MLDSVNPEFKQGNYFNEEDSELIVETWELVADIVGIVDPSPTCDIFGAICAKAQGDNVGTAISVASIVPGLDIAKLGKIAKKVKVIEKLIDRAKHSDEFLTVIRPALEYIRKKIADGIDCVEEGLKKTLQDLKDKLDDLLDKTRNWRSPAENRKARNKFKNHKDEAKRAWEEREGKDWPVDANGNDWPAEHSPALKQGGDPMTVTPRDPLGVDPHTIPGPDGLNDYQRWGALGTPAREANRKAGN